MEDKLCVNVSLILASNQANNESLNNTIHKTYSLKGYQELNMSADNAKMYFGQLWFSVMVSFCKEKFF